MKNRLLSAALLAMAIAPSAAKAAGAEVNVVRSVEVGKDGKGAHVVIAGSKAPTFTVFRLNDPPRVVVDLASADVSAVRGAKDGVTVSQFSDEHAAVGRVVVAVAADARYEVKARGNDVVVQVEGQGDAKQASAAPAPVAEVKVAEAAPAATDEAADPNVVTSRRDEKAVKNGGHRIEAVHYAQKNGATVVQVLTDGEVGTYELVELAHPPRLAIDLYGFNQSPRAAAKAPAGALLKETRFGKHEGKVRLVLDGGDAEKMAEYGIARVKGGLAITLTAKADPAVVAAAAAQAESEKAAKELALAQKKEAAEGARQAKLEAEEKAREDKQAKTEAEKAERQAKLEADKKAREEKQAQADADKAEKQAKLDAEKKAKAEAAEKAREEREAKLEAQKAERQAKLDAEARKAKLVSIKDVTFKGDEAKGRVVIAAAKGVEYQVAHPDPRTAVLTLKGATLPRRLERSLDTSAFGGPVKMVSSFVSPTDAETVQVVATLDGKALDKVAVVNGQLTWEFAAEQKAARADAAEVTIDGQTVNVTEESASVAPRAGAFSAEGGSYAVSGAPQKAKYTGRRVSFEFKDIDIHDLLRIMAEVSKRNVIVADNVAGRVTIRLRNVPWDQALDLILKSKSLDKEEMGNIIRIAPLKDMEEERKLRAEAIKNAKVQEPLKVRLIPVNYATATQISDKVKDLLSERGSMSVDTRTNVIIVKDTQDALARAEGLVRRLDTQTPQVLIEARIVEANSSFAREFGIQWGGNVALSPATGNPTGLSFPNVVRVAGASAPDGNQGTADIPNFAVNLPAPIGAGAGGGVGFIFGSAGGAVALNLRLSAMENNGQVKTISAPKITTLDNNPATIGQGISIPFSQTSASGVNTTFVEAKLELRCVPHVTADGSVLLDINATNNQPDVGITGANGQPSISKKEAKTQVLVKDGDTTVIGGIYTRSQSLNEAAVPVLSRIPVLGWLFKKKREVDNRTELLIFITPRIVNRNQVVAASE